MALAQDDAPQQVWRYMCIDGVKSGCVRKPAQHVQLASPTERVVGYLSTKENGTSPWDEDAQYMPYARDVESCLPPSFILAAHNRLSNADVAALAIDGSTSRPLFVYGALMFPSIVHGVARAHESLAHVVQSMTPARVSGFRRIAREGKPYPSATRDDGTDTIHGMLIFGVLERPGSRGSIERFQNSKSGDLTVAKASFVDADGLEHIVDCEMYVQTQSSHDAVDELLGRRWCVTDLMRDAWHCGNLRPMKRLEEELVASIIK